QSFLPRSVITSIKRLSDRNCFSRFLTPL
ncbi:hypothetical protein AVDCRST_MAG81-4854, partial [uncultured Synechococcales cyanobacterium]